MSPARKRAIRLAAAALIALSAGAAAAADFAAGMRAHLDKKYGESRRIFDALANGGDAQAQFMMGTIYEQGLGVPKDLAAAARWYRKAAEAGNASAQYNLGIFHQFGKGVAKDPVEAARLLRLAADQGHGRAQNNLSTFYFTGVGVPRDPVEAWKWLTLSADGLKGKGRQIALENRTVIEREMTADQVEAARRRVAEWRQQHGRRD
ncbi:MAG: tetratricopeptide repeat protein [Alphaproteobacteria bacterium]